ncbi:unnamed protein product [Prorocentrum cordatum]|uniref:Uncharacterized protein n=1 Tax=Prorocentrum cordatum TaxID=2364126 RepID=A0ABN9Y7K0_9DINO|nr:unnamed protein product [Polarella glacialis]
MLHVVGIADVVSDYRKDAKPTLIKKPARAALPRVTLVWILLERPAGQATAGSTTLEPGVGLTTSAPWPSWRVACVAARAEQGSSAFAFLRGAAELADLWQERGLIGRQLDQRNSLVPCSSSQDHSYYNEGEQLREMASAASSCAAPFGRRNMIWRRFALCRIAASDLLGVVASVGGADPDDARGCSGKRLIISGAGG